MKRCYDCVYCSSYYTRHLDVCDREAKEVKIEDVFAETNCHHFIESESE